MPRKERNKTRKPSRQELSRRKLFRMLLEEISALSDALKRQLEACSESGDESTKRYAAHTYNWLVYYCKSINTYYRDLLPEYGIEEKPFALDTVRPEDTDYDDLCEKLAYITSYRNHYSVFSF